MTDSQAINGVVLEITSPEGSTRRIPVLESPFLVGRGEGDNHLAIPDERISRRCAAIVSQRGQYYVEDRGNRRGVFVNGEKIDKLALVDGDVITFGFDDSFKLTYRGSERDTAAFRKWLSDADNASDSESATGLAKLNLLLEATRMMHSQLPLEALLEAMLDRAISITNADRGLLLEPSDEGSLRNRLARKSGSHSIAAETFSPSQTAIGMALKQESAVITEDLLLGEGALQGAQSILVQGLRVVVAIPLYSANRATAANPSQEVKRGQLLGLLYFDSRRPAAFSSLDRQILEAIASESASILDNARLVQREQERHRVEQELSIARDIQQILLPRGSRDFPHVSIRGINFPCYEVGGDYFDILSIDDQRAAFLIADVSGKGLGAALITTILQGVFSGLGTGGSPTRAFAHINEFLCEREELHRHCTVFFATLDREGNLEYLNAGHPSPLLLRNGKVTELFTKGSLPLGLIPGTEYAPAQARLEPGDTLVLFSDGITEAENMAGEFYGDQRLHDVLAGQTAIPRGASARVVNAVQRFVGKADPADDITLVLAKYRGSV